MGRSLGHLSDINPDDWREVPDFMLGPFWVGDFAPQLSTQSYGSNDFHGRFHPAIPWVAIQRFTRRGEVVWDPFSGSGTTLDVAMELGRCCIATDIHPARDDIDELDIGKPGAYPPTMVDLAILHPPYWDIIDYSCPMSSAKSLAGYISAFDNCFANVHAALKPGRVVVLVIGEIWRNGELIPLEYALDRTITWEWEYRRIGRIVKDFGETKGGSQNTNPKYNNLWKYRLLKYGYFKNGIDTILFYQK